MTKLKQSIIGIVMVSTLFITISSQAAPLPNGTKLTITKGVSSGAAKCTTGSCYGWGDVRGIIWQDIAPGTDGGIIIGKNQVSGGQELAPSAINNASGELSAAYIWLSNFGTITTTQLAGINPNAFSDASANIFDDSSCAGASCIGLTELGTWNMAWNGTVIPFGSAGGCLDSSCTADHLNGISVSAWTVNPDKTYSLDYSHVSPDGDPSGFGKVTYYLHLEGQIIASNAPEISGIWNGADPQFLFIFGNNFGTSPGVMVNGVDISTIQVLDDGLIIAILPIGIVEPFSVKINTPLGIDSFPKVCPI